ncbi:MAG: hypothetical protein AAF394_11525, partial [Planctomycetota bacterium]
MARLIWVFLLIACHLGVAQGSEPQPLRLISDVPVGEGWYFLHKLPLEGTVTPKNVARKFDAADGFPEAIVRCFA